jgi:hypothetical protein
VNVDAGRPPLIGESVRVLDKEIHIASTLRIFRHDTKVNLDPISLANP